VINKSTGQWASTVLSEVQVPVDLGIFQKIAAMAAAAVPLRTSPPPHEPPLTESEESNDAQSDSDSHSKESVADSEESAAASQESSGWESESSAEEDMTAQPLTLDLDTGAATFATS
jgi:hypothetical protein